MLTERERRAFRAETWRIQKIYLLVAIGPLILGGLCLFMVPGSLNQPGHQEELQFLRWAGIFFGAIGLFSLYRGLTPPEEFTQKLHRILNAMKRIPPPSPPEGMDSFEQWNQDLDGNGKVSIVAGQIVLKSFWLGTQSYPLSKIRVGLRINFLDKHRPKRVRRRPDQIGLMFYNRHFEQTISVTINDVPMNQMFLTWASHNYLWIDLSHELTPRR